MTWDAVAARIEAGATAVLPIGAGAKQHGLHLPLDTDRIQADFLATRLAERVDALIWPTVTYGFYPAFTAYAGSISLTRSTFGLMIREILNGILGFGVKRLLVLDTGVSTIAPVDDAIETCRAPRRVRHLTPYAGPRVRQIVETLQQQHGSHADEVETSIMLVLAPERVDTRRAAPALHKQRSKPGPLSLDPQSPLYSASGSFGDPTLATAEKGEALIAAMVEDLVEAARS